MAEYKTLQETTNHIPHIRKQKPIYYFKGIENPVE